VKAYLDCYPCFLSQTLKTARLLTSDEKKIKNILDKVAAELPQINFAATPAEIGREVYRIIARESGIGDPYRSLKKIWTEKALHLYPYLKKLIRAAADPLFLAVRVAIVGNVIDFGVNREFDLEKEVEQILHQPLMINHYQRFRDTLEKTSRVLYIADNAGETVFDRLLIEEMAKPVIYVVREKPVINDAVRQDAEEAGLNEVAEIISSGVDAPGTVLSLCSEEFRKMFFSAEMIISKGQGNYEGLSGEKGPLFFLLKAKCEVIARELNVPLGSLLLI
jgi:hypothetical protein